MNDARTRLLVETGRLRPRARDLPKIRSILDSAAVNAGITQHTIPLNGQTATIVFKEMYDALRQLGDSKWLLRGFDPQDHHVSMEILAEEDPIEFQHVDRFREIRNKANYKGYKVKREEAEEIISFWNKHAVRLLQKLRANLA